MKSFRKWIGRAIVILPKYKIESESEFKPNSKDGKYYRWEADLMKPLYEGGKNNVQSNHDKISEFVIITMCPCKERSG